MTGKISTAIDIPGTVIHNRDGLVIAANLGVYLAFRDENPVGLTTIEHDLLSILIEATPRIVTYDTLETTLWCALLEERRRGSLKLYILYLRRKLEVDPENPRVILNERARGYRVALKNG